MKAAEFCYWLQGYFELSGTEPKAMTPEQVSMVKAHLALVFIHDIDPAATTGLPPKEAKVVQNTLNVTHSGGHPPGGIGYRC